jgi:hypothetical protein
MNEIVVSADRFLDEWFDDYTWSVIRYPDGLTPNRYLEFANNDLADGNSQRNLINAASNATRSVYQLLGRKRKPFRKKWIFLVSVA